MRGGAEEGKQEIEDMTERRNDREGSVCGWVIVGSHRTSSEMLPDGQTETMTKWNVLNLFGERISGDL